MGLKIYLMFHLIIQESMNLWGQREMTKRKGVTKYKVEAGKTGAYM